MELIATLAGFALMGLLCALLERIWPEDRAQKFWRWDSPTDVAYFLIRVVLSVFLVLATALTGESLPRQSHSWIAGRPFWLQLIAFLVISDFVSYWVHRLEHEIQPLWRLHAVHHSAEQVDWLVAARNHPLELVLHKVSSSIPLYLIGFPPELFAIVVPAVATFSLLQHANLSWSFGPLRHVLASPAFHRWHHSSQAEALDKNYASLFPALDYLFGTAYFPRGVQPSRYGLKGETIPRGIWQHMLYPLRYWRRSLREWSHRRRETSAHAAAELDLAARSSSGESMP